VRGSGLSDEELISLVAWITADTATGAYLVLQLTILPVENKEEGEPH
jgi:hypothetical protein